MLAIERYRPADAAAVADLFGATPELPATTEASIRAFAALSFNRGARDFRVVRDPADPAAIVALLTSTLLEDTAPLVRHFRIVVHPAHRRRGIAARLMTEVEAATAPRPAVLQCNSQRSWTAGNALLERFGFAVAQRELLMRRSTALPPAPPPSGVSLRDATPADDAAWIALHEEGYGDRDDFVPLTADDLQAERGRPGFALVVAEREGRAVGLAHAMHHDDGGLVHSVVVRPELRGRGLGAALVAAIAQRLRAAGCAEVSLNVMASNGPAIALYRRLGFARYDELLTYRRAFGTPRARERSSP